MILKRSEISIIALVFAAILTSRTAIAEDTVHSYAVVVDDSLDRLQVEAEFSRPVTSVSARSRSAGRFLLDARDCREQNKIRLRNRRMMLPEAGIRCLRYTVDLQRAAKEYRSAASLHGDNIVASPAYWLWRPELTNGTQINVDFELPDEVRVSVPWPKRGESDSSYILRESPESARAPAVFGKYDYREITVPGATLRVALLNAEAEMNNDAIANWIQATATDVSLAYGRFPNPSPLVVVMPTSNFRTSVAFGRVIRDGGETVELLIDPDEEIARFFNDWTATHEFSHMLLPYLSSEFHWISEGFSQYYQNILLTRSGAYDAQRMWQNLYNGFERGRKSRPELSPNEATNGRVRSSRMKVYWSGAALAFMADVALRERSGGDETLDDVLDRLQACCLPSEDTWTGPEFFAKLDSLIDEPLFMPLYHRYADTAGFPDTSHVFARLGLSVSDELVEIERDGELTFIRDAMSITDQSTALWRGRLAAD